MRAILVFCSILLVLPGFLAVLARGRPLQSTLALRGGGPRTQALAAAVAVGLWVLSLGLLELQFAVWAPPAGYIESFRALHAALKATGPVDWLWSLVAIAVAPALCEELLMRGIVLPSFRPAFGTGLAVAGSAFLFAVIHLRPLPLPLHLRRRPRPGRDPGPHRDARAEMLAHGLLNALTFVAAPSSNDPRSPCRIRVRCWGPRSSRAGSWRPRS